MTQDEMDQIIAAIFAGAMLTKSATAALPEFRQHFEECRQALKKPQPQKPMKIDPEEVRRVGGKVLNVFRLGSNGRRWSW